MLARISFFIIALVLVCGTGFAATPQRDVFGEPITEKEIEFIIGKSNRFAAAIFLDAVGIAAGAIIGDSLQAGDWKSHLVRAEVGIFIGAGSGAIAGYYLGKRDDRKAAISKINRWRLEESLEKGTKQKNVDKDAAVKAYREEDLSFIGSVSGMVIGGIVGVIMGVE